GMNRRPPVECGRLVRQACAVGTDLQHGRIPSGHPAPDNDRHAPTRNERVELQLPTLRKIAQNGGQLVKPWTDLGPEPRREPPANSIVHAWKRAHAPTVAQPNGEENAGWQTRLD